MYISRKDLMKQVNLLEKKLFEISKQNETLEKGQDVLLQQVEYYRNSIDSEIRQIKQNMTLLLNPPKEEKKSFWDRLFKS